MKDPLIILIRNLPPVACVVGSILLALNDIEGWGWFIITALLLSSND
jgi:hypothetical protein